MFFMWSLKWNVACLQHRYMTNTCAAVLLFSVCRHRRFPRHGSAAGLQTLPAELHPTSGEPRPAPGDWLPHQGSDVRRSVQQQNTGEPLKHRRHCAGLWRREERLQLLLLLLLLFLSALRPPVFLSLWRSVFLFLFWRAVPPTSLTESPGGERPDQRQEKRAGLHAVQLQRDGSRLQRHHIHDFRPLQWPDQQVSARTAPERTPKAIARQWMELSQTQVETSRATSRRPLSLQHKPDKVYEWVREELLHMDLLGGIQDLGQDVPGEDVRKKQWRCGVPAGGALVQWAPGWILLSSGLPESSSAVHCAHCVQPKHTSFMWTCKAWI